MERVGVSLRSCRGGKAPPTFGQADTQHQRPDVGSTLAERGHCRLSRQCLGRGMYLPRLRRVGCSPTCGLRFKFDVVVVGEQSEVTRADDANVGG
jgi:hypothetical protein